MKKQYWFLLSLLTISMIGINYSCNNTSGENTEDTTEKSAVPVISFSITSTLPHDTSYFTEGLEFYDSTLLESTGLNGQSRLVQYNPKTGKVLKQIRLDSNYFGEGITVLHDTLYQLTYQQNVVFV